MDHNKKYYDMIFKRKSFHLFRNTEPMDEQDLKDLKAFIKAVQPLDDSIRVEIRIVPEAETTCKRGAQYCIEFYSEEKENDLRNIGYIGEQIDLWLAERNIGALWYGIGRPEENYTEKKQQGVINQETLQQGDQQQESMQRGDQQ
ncbi:MAG: nitroreductase family protein, partial [Lachnospiraceae bacterium]|nr:nitroreductase family protein [Lachnospiraceae bacterium]